MAIAADISVAVNGDIRYTGTTANYTVIELHRFLQDLADNASSTGDDLLDITNSTPSDRSTDNIVTLNSPYNVNDALAQHIYDGSITQANGDTVYSGLVVVGAVPSGTQLMLVQANTLITDFWGTGINTDPANNILLRMLVKTRDLASDIDGKRLRVQARELGDTYAEFSLTMGLGNSTAAIFTSIDLNNQTAPATIAAWLITNTEGLNLLDVDGDSTTEPYYSQWALAGQSINDLFEFTKYNQRRGSAGTLHGMNGQLFRGITHSFAYSTEVGGPFTQNESLAWGTGATAGTGILLALDDAGTTGNLYIQVTSGAPPIDTLTVTGGASAATCVIAGAPVARTVSPEFLGTSTGSALIGAYGIGVTPADLSKDDKLFDLTNTQVTPPNNVSFSVGGLVVGEDRVLVGPELAGALDVAQMAVLGATAAGSATLVMSASIPTDTPSAGTVRVYNGTIYEEVPYASYSGATFTLTGTLPNAVAAAANCFVAYLDILATAISESFTSVYLADRNLYIRVRDGGTTPIKTFETTGTLGSAGGSTTAIRASDS